MNTRALLLCLTLAGFAGPASAGDDNPECLGSSCGKPKEEGGGCGCGCSVWVAYTDDGKTLAYTDDADGDGKADDTDNCPFASNRDQLDEDGDGVGNSCDNCAAHSNFTQLDTDGDGQGDTCDGDLDGDGVPNADDNCASIPNKLQANADVAEEPTTKMGDVCDDDDDNDGVLDRVDFCPTIKDPTNTPQPGNPVCNIDTDADSILDAADNCPTTANLRQDDTDNDGMGNVCDLDTDNDGINDKKLDGLVFADTNLDNCPGVSNRSQLDDDGDGQGDVCDARYCVVIDPANKADCLDPLSPFRMHSGGTVVLKAGEKFRLPLFANRNGAGIEYTWSVVTRPGSSKAPITNPTGVVSMSRHWEYAYLDGATPTFVADVDGEYELQLSARLAVPDRAYPAQRSSVSSLKLSAAPDGKPGSQSCASIPLDAPWLVLGALAGLKRRKRLE